MPAVLLSRLKSQIDALAGEFSRPARFQSEVLALFDLYADRVYRPGQVVQASLTLPQYHLPPLVMQQLELYIFPLCQKRPLEALAVIDQLWLNDYAEPRLFAAAMLGQVSLSSSDLVLSRLVAWSQPSETWQILEALFNVGTVRLRHEMPDRWFAVIKDWLEDRSTAVQILGLRALIPMIQDRDIENLPPVFSMVSPLMQSASPTLQPELIQVLQALYQRIPQETVYYLRQMIGTSNNPGTHRMVRKLLPMFEPEARAGLRSILQSRG